MSCVPVLFSFISCVGIMIIIIFVVTGEADLVVHHIKKLHNSGVLDKDIAVIAPYSLQVYFTAQYTCT